MTSAMPVVIIIQLVVLFAAIRWTANPWRVGVTLLSVFSIVNAALSLRLSTLPAALLAAVVVAVYVAAAWLRIRQPSAMAHAPEPLPEPGRSFVMPHDDPPPTTGNRHREYMWRTTRREVQP